MVKNLREFKSLAKNYSGWILFAAIFCLSIFLRFYNLENTTSFTWDQVDNAWAAYRIIVEHNLPLLGMTAKLNTGIHIGPFYYYLAALFYWLTDLDPIASGIFAGATSIFTFLVLFFIVKKIFSFNTALFAVFLNTFSFGGITFDKVQWPVAFIPAVSLIIFYCLYKILIGSGKYILLLALILGFSFNIHFTSIFFLIIILFTLPFFPWNKETVKYFLLGLPLFLLWLIPSIISETQTKNADTQGILRYSSVYYHGLHLRRVIQLVNDAFIQFEPYFFYAVLKPLKYVLLPLFTIFIIFFGIHKRAKSEKVWKFKLFFVKLDLNRQKLVMVYLTWLWFLIPWLALSLYKGEISEYYFSINRFIALMILAYFINKIFEIKKVSVKYFLIIFLLLYGFANSTQYLNYYQGNLVKERKIAKDAINNGRVIQFHENLPSAYLYRFYLRKRLH